MKKCIITGLLLSTFVGAMANQIAASVSHQFKAGTPANAEQVNANFNELAANVQSLVGKNAYIASSSAQLLSTIKQINASHAKAAATIYLTPGVTYQLKKGLDVSNGHEIILTSLAQDSAVYPKLYAYQSPVLSINGTTPVHLSHITLAQTNPRLAVVSAQGGHISAQFNNVVLLSAANSQAPSIQGNAHGQVSLSRSTITNSYRHHFEISHVALKQNLTIS